MRNKAIACAPLHQQNLTRKLNGAHLVPLIGDDLHPVRARDKQEAPGSIHTLTVFAIYL